MSVRITRHDLGSLTEQINHLLGDGDLTVEWAYGQPRVYRAGGSVEVSPRLANGELWRWLHAYEKGIIAGREVYR